MNAEIVEITPFKMGSYIGVGDALMEMRLWRTPNEIAMTNQANLMCSLADKWRFTDVNFINLVMDELVYRYVYGVLDEIPQEDLFFEDFYGVIGSVNPPGHVGLQLFNGTDKIKYMNYTTDEVERINDSSHNPTSNKESVDITMGEALARVRITKVNTRLGRRNVMVWLSVLCEYWQKQTKPDEYGIWSWPLDIILNQIDQNKYSYTTAENMIHKRP
jgi:hypothetical protein